MNIFKCCECKKRENITNIMKFYSLGGEAKLRYCAKCYAERVEEEKLFREADKKRYEPKLKEEIKNRRYLYLKR